jgi:hypothetical protein
LKVAAIVIFGFAGCSDAVPPPNRDADPASPGPRKITKPLGADTDVHVFLHASRIPTREAWQQAIERLGFATVLDPTLDVRHDKGYSPATYQGKATGFEFSLDSSPEILQSFPDIVQHVGGREVCATFRWSGDLTEAIAALCAAASLAKLTGGIGYSPGDDETYSADEIVASVRESLLHVTDGASESASDKAAIGGEGDPRRLKMNESFVKQLEALGFFRGTLAEQDAVKAKILASGWSGIFADSQRMYHADAEDLAEGGVGNFLRRIEPFLSAEKVALPKIRDEYADTHYTVHLDTQAHRIHVEAEWRADGYIPWALATARTFAIVNRLLESAGSRERLYALNGGNDLFAWFLTPELHKVIVDHPDAVAKDTPYRPTESPPLFGRSKEQVPH